MHVFFAIDADHLSRDKVGVRRGQKESRADEIFSSRGWPALFSGLPKAPAGIFLDRFGDRKARRHDIDRDPVFAELPRNAARKPMIPALAAA